jgi:tRNA pseudouridine55 synthase
VIDGILSIDKPSGWTSHDVVARVRRITGQREVGHAGTLDPLATGLLILVLGAATRLSAYLMESDKTYCADMLLGVTTTTDDAEGAILDRCSVPELDPADIEGHLRRFMGEIEQVPPAYSAVHQGGERLHRLARKGVAVDSRPRRVVIHRLALEELDLPRLRVIVRCGSGTYIRALARDLGAALGTGAHLCALRRVASGSFAVEDAAPLDGLTRDEVLRWLQPLDRAVIAWPAVVLSAEEASRVCHGRAVPLGCLAPGNVRLYGPGGELVALGRGAGSEVRPFRVFAQVESRADSR